MVFRKRPDKNQFFFSFFYRQDDMYKRKATEEITETSPKRPRIRYFEKDAYESPDIPNKAWELVLTSFLKNNKKEDEEMTVLILFVLSHVNKQLNRICVKFFENRTYGGKFRTTRTAIKLGWNQVLEYLLKETQVDKEMVCSDAIYYQGVECLKFVHGLGCPLEMTCYTATEKGDLKSLIYAHENGALWDGEFTCANAAQRGHLDCLTYAYQNDSPLKLKREFDIYGDPTLFYVVEGKEFEVKNFAHVNCIEYLSSLI